MKVFSKWNYEYKLRFIKGIFFNMTSNQYNSSNFGSKEVKKTSF